MQTDEGFVRQHVATNFPNRRGNGLEIYSGDIFIDESFDPKTFSMEARRFIQNIRQEATRVVETRKNTGDAEETTYFPVPEIVVEDDRIYYKVHPEINHTNQLLLFEIINNSDRIKQILTDAGLAGIYFTHLKHFIRAAKQRDDLVLSDELGERIGTLLYHATSNFHGAEFYRHPWEPDINLIFSNSPHDNTAELRITATDELSQQIKEKVFSGQQRIRSLLTQHLQDPGEEVDIYVNNSLIKPDFSKAE